jgi:microcystin-dependent protein
MRAIYENEIIGDPVYFGLMFGGELEFPTTDDFTKADWPGLRAIRVRNGALEEWILARDLPDDYEITVSPGAASVGGVPTGSIMPYAAATPPAGWLPCDGSAVSRATYADLFGVIGTVWGVGDGSTTFNLPNLEDRFLTGAGNTYAIAATGGAATVTLATSEIPGHTHTGPSHTHTGPSHTHTGPSHIHTMGTHTHTGPSHTHTGPSHTHGLGTLDTDTEPNHTHSFSDTSGGPSSTSAEWNNGSVFSGASTTHTHSVSGTTGSGGTHQHAVDSGATAASGTAATGASGTGATGATDPGDTAASGTAATGASGTAATGASGTADTGTANPPFVAVNYIIKT